MRTGRIMMLHRPLLIAAAALALTAGCAGGSAGELDTAVRSYSAAFLSGQGDKAAGMLSARWVR
jgi:hypothetical protein